MGLLMGAVGEGNWGSKISLGKEGGMYRVFREMAL